MSVRPLIKKLMGGANVLVTTSKYLSFKIPLKLPVYAALEQNQPNIIYSMVSAERARSVVFATIMAVTNVTQRHIESLMADNASANFLLHKIVSVLAFASNHTT